MSTNLKRTRYRNKKVCTSECVEMFACLTCARGKGLEYKHFALFYLIHYKQRKTARNEDWRKNCAADTAFKKTHLKILKRLKLGYKYCNNN